MSAAYFDGGTRILVILPSAKFPRHCPQIPKKAFLIQASLGSRGTIEVHLHATSNFGTVCTVDSRIVEQKLHYPNFCAAQNFIILDATWLIGVPNYAKGGAFDVKGTPQCKV